MQRRTAAGAGVVAVLLAVTGCTSGGGSAETAVQVLHTYRGTAVAQTTPSSSDVAATTSELALPERVSRQAVVRVTLQAAEGEPSVLRLRPDPTVASRAR